jgi:hypothetical protein
MRRRIAIAVVVLHGLLLWLLASGLRNRPDAEPLMPQFVSLWITMPVPDTPEIEPERDPQRDPEQRPAPRSRATEAPRTAPITLPSAPPVQTVPESTTSPVVPAPAPALDWAQRAQLAARRAADAGEAQKQGESFSPAPEVMRKPCKPKKSNLDSAEKDETGFHMVGPLPVWVGKRCTITIGFIGCGLGKLPEARGDLFDDMKGPGGAPSSVPDPDICD